MTELRTRREPPPFRRLTVRRTESISPHMTRVSLGGKELEGFDITEPAASVRLLLPIGEELEIPVWAGNEFLMSNGTRPILRTFTPRRLDEEKPGTPYRRSSPRRGCRIDMGRNNTTG